MIAALPIVCARTVYQPAIVRQETKKVGQHFTKYPWTIFYQDAAAGYQKALNL